MSRSTPGPRRATDLSTRGNTAARNLRKPRSLASEACKGLLVSERCRHPLLHAHKYFSAVSSGLSTVDGVSRDGLQGAWPLSL